VAFTIPVSEYDNFVLAVNTLTLLIPIAGLGLHIPLTRDIKIGKSGILDSYVWLYRIGSLTGFSFMVLAMIVLDLSINISITLVFSIGLIFWAFHEYFIGYNRGLQNSVYVGILISIPGITRFTLGIIVLAFDYVSIEVFSLIFVAPFYLSFIFNVIYSKEATSGMFSLTLPSLIDLKVVMKDGLSSFITIFANNSVLWMVIFIGTLLLNDLDFRAFDLIILIISLITMVTGNLTLSILQVYSSEKYEVSPERRKQVNQILIIGIILSALVLFALIITKSYWLLLFDSIFGNVNQDLIWAYLMIIVFVPVLMTVSAITKGIFQASGNLVTLAKIDTLASLTVVILSLIVMWIASSTFIPILFYIYNITHIVAFNLWFRKS
jgi:O-antigen/teichoic acid export membrane protein